MKKVIFVMLVFLAIAFNVSAHETEKSDQMQQKMPMEGGSQQMPMDECTMHKQMPGGVGQQISMIPMMKMHMSVTHDIMHTIKDMMKIQERMLKGASDEEKKKMAREISVMMMRTDKMISDMHGMMETPPAEQPKTAPQDEKTNDQHKH